MAGLLVGGAACGIPGDAALGRATGGGAYGIGSPGEAFMPTPGRAAVPYAKKARTFVRALISNMAVRGGD